MTTEYRIVSVDKPEWGLIGGAIHNYNIAQAGDDHSQSVCILLKDPNDEFAGGLVGEVHWNWFYISLLWIKEELRGQGYGDRILAMAEAEARQHGALNAYLDTFSFQAPDFYQQRGYQVFGQLSDFPTGHQRFYMKKEL